MALLTSISSKLDKSLPAVMAGNIVTSCITSKPTSLQIALGITSHDFFAAGHCNYARYGLYYLRSITKVPDCILKAFMKGEHVMRHQAGVWNAIWSDQYIESTFMRFGHGQEGIIGITLQPETLKRWALGLHICTKLKKDIKTMVRGDVEAHVMTHKEEGRSRIKSDSNDRSNIRDK